MGTSARVKITLDVEAGSSWSDDVQVSQVRKQATADVLGKLNRVFATERGIKIVGEPVVTVVSSQLDPRP